MPGPHEISINEIRISEEIRFFIMSFFVDELGVLSFYRYKGYF